MMFTSMLLSTVMLTCIPGPVKDAAVLCHDTAFTAGASGMPEGWTAWSPRGEIAPRMVLDPRGGRSGGGALRIEGGSKPAAFGAWRRRVEGVTGGQVYRFSAFYRAAGVAHERRSVAARLDWLDAKGERAQPPDYALESGRD